MSWKQCSIGVLLLPLMMACTDPTEVEDFAGTWNATFMEFTNLANSAEKFDLIVEGGSLSIQIASTGDYTLSILFPLPRRAKLAV